MTHVYILWFVHRWEDPDRDDEPLVIGVYRTDADARAAIDRLKNKPGFLSMPEGFEIVEYELNKDHWTEGYIVD